MDGAVAPVVEVVLVVVEPLPVDEPVVLVGVVEVDELVLLVGVEEVVVLVDVVVDVPLEFELDELELPELPGVVVRLTRISDTSAAVVDPLAVPLVALAVEVPVLAAVLPVPLDDELEGVVSPSARPQPASARHNSEEDNIDSDGIFARCPMRPLPEVAVET